MRLPCRRTAILAIASGAAVVLTAGTASAYWGTSGAGYGTARAGAADGLNITPGTLSTPLAPGGTTDVTVVLSNPGSYPVLVTGAFTPDGGLPGYSDAALTRPISTCDSAHSGVTALLITPRKTSIVVAAHGSYTLTISNAVTMSNSSVNACQGAYFAVPVSVDAQSAAGSAPTLPAVGTL